MKKKQQITSNTIYTQKSVSILHFSLFCLPSKTKSKKGTLSLPIPVGDVPEVASTGTTTWLIVH